MDILGGICIFLRGCKRWKSLEDSKEEFTNSGRASEEVIFAHESYPASLKLSPSSLPNLGVVLAPG